MPGSVAAIVLAGGASRRMGSCKQLLRLAGETVLARCLKMVIKGGVEQVIVVVPPTADEVAAEAARFPVQVVCNRDAEGDMVTSICTGRAGLSSPATGVLIALCDYPLVRPETVSLLISGHRLARDRVLIPCHDGRRGHPILVPRPLLEQLQTSQTLRDLLREHKELIQHLNVADEGVLIDMDTPEDYHRIAALFHPAK